MALCARLTRLVGIIWCVFANHNNSVRAFSPKSHVGKILMCISTNARNVLVVFAFFLAGCSTAPISSSQAINVAGGRHVSFKAATPGTAPVIITRDTGIMSAACSTKVSIDGTLAAYIRAGEKVTLYIAAGDVIIGAQPDGVCAGGLVEIEARLQAGKPAHYRIGYDHNGSLGLYRTAIK